MYDIIGDVHGCFDELLELISKLGYVMPPFDGDWYHPEGRRLCFVGDYVDRGPKSMNVLKLLACQFLENNITCVLGNHDDKLRRYIKGNNVQVKYKYFLDTVDEFNTLRGFEKELIEEFLNALPKVAAPTEKLVVVHGAFAPWLPTKEYEHALLYGIITGETDEYGLPVRSDEWTSHQSWPPGLDAVRGHEAIEAPQALCFGDRTVFNVDTGCAFGGSLTALRYPECQFVSVKAHQVYSPRN